MDGRPTWTDCDEAGDYVLPNVLSPRDLVSRPDLMDKTVPHTYSLKLRLMFLWRSDKNYLSIITIYEGHPISSDNDLIKQNLSL